jgi:SARP family transcriptional regulator, regulator of embCAB operon
MVIRICGPLSAEIDGRPLEGALRGLQGRMLFAFLVLHRDRAVSRSELIDALWPNDAPQSAQATLSTLLSRLRRSLGEGMLAGRAQLQLMPSGEVWVDLEAAEQALASAQTALDRALWGEAREAAEAALSVAERGFLPEADAPWVEEQRRWLDELSSRALECLAAAGLGLGGGSARWHGARGARACAALALSRDGLSLLDGGARAAR